MLNWNPKVKAQAKALEQQFAAVEDSVALFGEIQRQATARYQSFMAGLQAYHAAPKPQVAQGESEVIWQGGASSVLDYGSAKKKTKALAVLFVPSLINRAYILDLAPGLSMIEHMKSEGFQPLLLDWGTPGKEEFSFTIGDYITKRLLPAIEAAAKHTGGPVVLAGYCMGGLMTLAAALQQESQVAGLALLATPWDFHSKDVESVPLTPENAIAMANLFERWGIVPKEFVYSMFYLQNPWQVHEKYARFATMKNKEEREAFVARETWVHDGVPLTAPAAKECFLDWANDNTPGQLRWEVAGEVVNPAAITQPTFIATPSYDHIVPPLCAKPLTDLIANTTEVACPTGHVGMIVGKHAREHVWNPLAKWLSKI